SEAAWQIARRGVPAVLHEMRPHRSTAVHKSGQFAELVCSNSFRSDDAEASAVGREGFAAAITAAIESEPLIDIRREEILDPPADWDSVISATGPLTSPAR